MSINYIFPVGRRCNSSSFLRDSKLSRFAGPMDYMFIDLQTAKECIEDKFSNFLNDIVHNNEALLYEKNTTSIDSKIDKDVKYFKSKWNNVRINQNYLPSVYKEDIYDWDRMCVFIHHAIEDQNVYNDIKMRCDRLVRCLDYNCLFVYFTEIIYDVEREMQRIQAIQFKERLFVVIFTAVSSALYMVKAGNIIFLVLKCDGYEEQSNRLNDNDVFNTKEILNTLLSVYKLDLLDSP